MGVAGLWDVLRPAGTIRSLSHIAIVDGFEADKAGKRGYRIGIDASIWFFHAKTGKDGENPELRTLFFRCATLMKAPFLPLFVFDGPLRPAVKRGKRINGDSASPLTNSMKMLVEAFGFEWRVAPGEAEAELAYLNRIGVLDGILSDDVDTFLFGAATVIRNPSNSLSANASRPVLNSVGKDDKNHTMVFTAEAFLSHERVGLSQPDLILIALLSGGDYHTGVDGCGIKIAVGLAKCGYGKSLVNAAKTKDKAALRTFLAEWRDQVREELRTNQSGLLPSKKPSLVPKVTDQFPDIDVLTQYVRPVVSSEFPEKALHARSVTWEKGPDLALIAQCCEQFFEWGYKDKIIKRFRTVIWPAAALRTLHSIMVQNQSSLSKITLTGENTEDGAFMSKVHSARNHPFTDHLLEYRVEVHPAELVRLAESGIRGTRRPEDEDNWKGAVPEYMREEEEQFNFDSDEETDGKRGKKDKGPVDPTSSLRVWLPASMLEATAPSLIRRYEEKKAKKTKAKSKKAAAPAEKEAEEESWNTALTSTTTSEAEERPAKNKRRTTTAKSKGKTRSTVLQEVSEVFSPSRPTRPTNIDSPSTPSRTWSRTQTDPTPVRAPVQPFPMSKEDFGPSQGPPEDDSDWEIHSGSPMKVINLVDREAEKADWEEFLSTAPTGPELVPMDISPAPPPRVKTKTRAVSSTQLSGLKSHFSTVKPGAIAKTTKTKAPATMLAQSKASTSALSQSILDIQQMIKKGAQRRNAKDTEGGESDSSWEVEGSSNIHPLTMEVEESDLELDSPGSPIASFNKTPLPIDMPPIQVPRVKTKVVNTTTGDSTKSYFATAKTGATAKRTKAQPSTSHIPQSIHTSSSNSTVPTPSMPQPPVQSHPLLADDFFSSHSPSAIQPQESLDSDFSDIEFDSPHKAASQAETIPSIDTNIPVSRSPSPIRRFSRTTSAPSALSLGGRQLPRSQPLPDTSIIEISSGEDTPPRPKARATSARPPSKPAISTRRLPMTRQQMTNIIREDDIIDLT